MQRLLVSTALTLALCSGCSSPGVTNAHFEQTKTGSHWFAQVAQQAPEDISFISTKQPYISNFSTPFAEKISRPKFTKQISSAPPLSPGDRIRVWLANSSLFSGVYNEADSEFSSIFEINIDGFITLPYINPIAAANLTIAELDRKIRQELVQQKLFKPGMAGVQVAIAEWAPISVFVSGAVFNPGQVTINQRRPEERQMMRGNQSGDFPLGRLIQSALSAAGGVSPDADVANIELLRNGKVYTIDMLGAVLGLPTNNVALTHGDIIRVNSSGKANLALLKPSAITPPGISINISNLTRPAFHNAASAISKESTSLPYGTRLLSASINGNCVGGAASTNSDRIVVLISTDPITRKRVAIERHVEDLLRAPHRLDLNPFMMPNDSIACYDSKVSNLRDIGLAITDMLFPVSLIIKSVNLW